MLNPVFWLLTLSIFVTLACFVAAIQHIRERVNKTWTLRDTCIFLAYTACGCVVWYAFYLATS